MCDGASGIAQNKDARGCLICNRSFGAMEADFVPVKCLDDVPNQAAESRAAGEEHHVVARSEPA